MKQSRKPFSRFLSLLLVLALILASSPALADGVATETDLLPIPEEPAEAAGEAAEDAGEIPGETPGTPEAQDSGDDAEPDPETGLAFLNAGTELFADENLQRKQGTLEEKAVVLVLGTGEKAASVCYALREDEGKAVRAEGFVPAGAPRLLTEEEQAAWMEQNHPVVLQADGFPLEPVVFVQPEPEKEEPEGDPAGGEPAEDAEGEPADDEGEPAGNDDGKPAEDAGEEPGDEAEEESDGVPEEESAAPAETGDAEENVQPQPVQEPPTGTAPADPEETGSDAPEQEAQPEENPPVNEEVPEPLNLDGGHIRAPEETAEDASVPESEEPEGSVAESGAVFSMADGIVTAGYQAQYENPQLPSARAQGVWGTCWAFTAVGAMEIDLIQGKAASTAIDLSELFLIYFAAHNYPYAKDGGEGDDLAVSGNYLNVGGNNIIAYRILANLIGTVAEGDAPYNKSAEPDLPAKYSSVAAQITGAYLISPSDRDAVKQAILDHGAVGASINSKHSYNEANNCMYGTGTRTDHDVLLVGWDDSFSKSKFSSPQPEGNGAWKVRNSWGAGLQDYFWISYYDAALLSEDSTAYDASNQDISDFCYSYDKTPYPGGYYYTTDQAVVRQTFTVDGSEKLQAVGVETGSERTDISVSVRIGGQEVASGSASAAYKGFYRVELSPAYSVSSRTDVEVAVTYRAQVSGQSVYVPYEKIGTEELSGGSSAYRFTADSGSGGFWFNDEKKQGDARLKLYTRKTATNGPSSVTLTPSSITGLKTGETRKLTAEASGASLLWYSSDTGAAIVEQDGTVIGGPQGGTAVITAIAANGVYANCTVTSTPQVVHVQGVQIEGFNGAKNYTINEKNSNGLKLGDAMSISCGLTPAYPTEYTVSWSTSNADIIEVEDQVSKRCDIRIRNNGIARLTVTVTDKKSGSVYTDYIDITVYLPIHVTSVSLEYDSLALWEGESFFLTGTAWPEDADNRALTWSSSNPAVASVDGIGFIRALKDGTAVITATSVDGGHKADCTVTVQTQDPVEAFVYRMYRICLLREPDDGGFRNWVNALNAGSLTGSEMAYGFYYSEEMRTRGLSDAEFVTRAYNGILGRSPDAAGLADWTGRLEQGVSWQHIIAGFTNSQEFTGLCEQYGIVRGTFESAIPRDQNFGITAYVSRLYTKMLGRGYDENGLNNWCAAILQSPTRQKALDVALEGFMHSQEFLNKKLNDVDFVKVLYRTFLDREFDPAGLDDWVGRLASGQTREQVAAGFAGSREFTEIMAAYGLN